MMAPAAPAGGAAPAAGAAAAEEAAPAAEKTHFLIKLEAFDAGSKIKLIKEVRAYTGLGLEEAKELVEKAPAEIRADVPKAEVRAAASLVVPAHARTDAHAHARRASNVGCAPAELTPAPPGLPALGARAPPPLALLLEFEREGHCVTRALLDAREIGAFAPAIRGAARRGERGARAHAADVNAPGSAPPNWRPRSFWSGAM